MNLPEYIKEAKKNWKLNYHYKKTQPSYFNKKPVTNDKFIDPSISRYLEKVKLLNHSSSYVSYCEDISILALNNCGSCLISNIGVKKFTDISSKYDLEIPEVKYTKIVKHKSVLLSMDSSCNYFHWICQVIPRLKLLINDGVDLSTIKTFLIPPIKGPFVIESLKRIGISENQLVEQEKGIKYIFKNIIIPSEPNRHIHITDWSIEFINNLFKTNKKCKFKKIYIHREKNKGGGISNQTELYSYLNKLNYKKVILENLTILEQAAIFKSAEIIISPHGASLANLIFCKKNTKIIELFSFNFFSPLYWNISNLLNLDYHYVKSSSPLHNKTPSRKNLIDVNIKTLSTFIH